MGATEVTIGQFKQFCATCYKTQAEQHAVALKRAGSTYLDPGFAVTDDSNDARHLKLAEEKIAAMK